MGYIACGSSLILGQIIFYFFCLHNLKLCYPLALFQMTLTLVLILNFIKFVYVLAYFYIKFADRETA